MILFRKLRHVTLSLTDGRLTELMYLYHRERKQVDIAKMVKKYDFRHEALIKIIYKLVNCF